MCPIPGTFPTAIRSFWELATVLMHKITSRQSALSLVMKIISISQKNHVKPLREAVVAKGSKSKARMTVASGSATKINLMESNKNDNCNKFGNVVHNRGNRWI